MIIVVIFVNRQGGDRCECTEAVWCVSQPTGYGVFTVHRGI